MIQILARKRKSNPLLLGEPGVGKTAIGEGLAAAIVNQVQVRRAVRDRAMMHVESVPGALREKVFGSQTETCHGRLVTLVILM